MQYNVLRLPDWDSLLVAGTVLRYFFTVGNSEREILADPHGILLPNIEAARLRALLKIRELHGRSGYDDPALVMKVTDETHHTVLFFPLTPCD